MFSCCTVVCQIYPLVVFRCLCEYTPHPYIYINLLLSRWYIWHIIKPPNHDGYITIIIIILYIACYHVVVMFGVV